MVVKSTDAKDNSTSVISIELLIVILKMILKRAHISVECRFRDQNIEKDTNQFFVLLIYQLYPSKIRHRLFNTFPLPTIQWWRHMDDIIFYEDLNTLPLFRRRIHQTINYAQFPQVYILCQMSTFCPQSELQNHYWPIPKTSWEKPQNSWPWMNERTNE